MNYHQKSTISDSRPSLDAPTSSKSGILPPKSASSPSLFSLRSRNNSPSVESLISPPSPLTPSTPTPSFTYAINPKKLKASIDKKYEKNEKRKFGKNVTPVRSFKGTVTDEVRPSFLHPMTPEFCFNLNSGDDSYSDRKPDSGFESEKSGGGVTFSASPHPRSILYPVSNPTFFDAERSVDFVLVWELRDYRACTEDSVKKRRVFETNLALEGLQLEYEKPDKNGLTFVKIHAPKDVLRRYCDILKLRMPMREIPGLQEVHAKTRSAVDEVNLWFKKIVKMFHVSDKTFPQVNHQFTAVYSRDREYLFDLDSPDFFTPAVRARVIQFILDRKRFIDDNSDEFAFGMPRLINEHVYAAAYPLHDGDVRTPNCFRYQLFNEWAALKNIFKLQPLDYIREYFGVKIALYFAWLGFYTHMLIPASIVGVLCFIYSCATLWNDTQSQEICSQNDDVKMCPRCDKYCDYWKLKDSCMHSKITYLFDNPSTVFFAVFMSFWAAIFLEFWKRYSAEITHRWDLTSYDILEEHPRPEYLARLRHVKQFRVNTVTNTWEPRASFWQMRLPATVLSFSVVFFLVFIAISTVLGVVLYRMSTLTALSMYGEQKVTTYIILFTSTTGATINLACILIFNLLYEYIARYVTELELLRTQTEYEDSVTLKIYMLQFVNYYSSIFYIAFFKGAFVGRPGEYKRLFNYRLEECSPGGCLTELCIQLSIIMIGKQIMNSGIEMLIPQLLKWYNTWKLKHGMTRRSNSKIKNHQWLKDFKLIQWDNLHAEYLEMVLQYGFVTIFVAAFPLAPFFALLNNAFEMRLDAQKLLIFYRRPVTQRVRDIGIWFRILDTIGKLSIVTNAFIIAFTSSFIPKMVYVNTVSPDNSLIGYVNFSLAIFNTSDFSDQARPLVVSEEVSICRYPALREPPGKKDAYELASVFWHVLAARLAFIVVFENFVAFLIILVRWCIPTIPGELRDIIKRETYITNEIITRQEAMRALGQVSSKSEISLYRTVATDRSKYRGHEKRKWCEYSESDFIPVEQEDDATECSSSPPPVMV